MPRFLYTGDGDRYYPSLALTPAAQATYELDADPGDGRWQPADEHAWTSQVAITPEPEPEPEPADEPHDTTGGE